MSNADLDTDSKTAWISQGFERLIDRVRKPPAAVHFDVLIIGSGYGGAIAAATFAGRRYNGALIKVGVLERGKEYLPGSFPTGLSELPGHIRLDHNKEGLFDVRAGPEVTTVLANGVGGGSLINAGVMEVPAPSVFRNGWPRQLTDLSTWSLFFDRARELLGASINGIRNTIIDHVDGVPQKHRSIGAIAPAGTFRAAAITVAMKDSTSSGNVALQKCVRCGDCATGCNFGAKNSLDVNLLVRAQQNGAEIFTGATVLSIEKDGGTSWIVNAVHTDSALRERDGDVPLRVRASKVVLAAGTLGSSEILLRSRERGLQVSDQLGKRCSTNGDMLIADYATNSAVHTVADESVQPSTRAIGPTITGVIDLRATAGVVIEEMSVPAGLRVAFTEVFATINTLHATGERDLSTHKQGFPNDDIYVAPAARVERSALYAVMGDDGAAGRIELEDISTTTTRDGMARIRWDTLQYLPLFDSQVETLAKLTECSGGRVIPNPAWKLLPAELTWLLKDQRGPLITVHPLGGCAMGDTGSAGVVDQYGRVFSTSTSTNVHDNLVVLDGSVIPTALGTNPALTISALALRAAEALAIQWNYNEGPPRVPSEPLVRPIFRWTDVAIQRTATQVGIIERLVGPVRFKSSDGATKTRIVELTLRFSPTALAQLTPCNGGNPIIEIAADEPKSALQSRIRIFPQDAWDWLERSWQPPNLKEKMLDAIVDFSAPLTGNLRILERQNTCAIGRIFRAGKAWLRNRGLRDLYQGFVYGDAGATSIWQLLGSLPSRFTSGVAIASRSGEVRALVYDLSIGIPDRENIKLDDTKIVGRKTFTYERRCNPWRQLMEVTLERFPGLDGNAEQPVLTLDVRQLARIGVPLFQITQQHNAVSAIGDLVTFFGYFVRLLLGLHIWSFRAPDKDLDETKLVDHWPPPALHIPGHGCVAAEIHFIPIPEEKPEDGRALVSGTVRLTHYPYPNAVKRPVVMFHGYSAGGTTFAHHAVNPNMASYFWSTGRDVWIADLRTSPGQPTAKEAWSLDQIGKRDVPEVLKFVSDRSGGGKVDVIAHCMGTVVFSIAVLSGNVRDLVSRAAFTQVGPLVVFSPANIFRAYVLHYLINFLPDSYSFNPTNPTLADELWDRLLSTLPYPEEEFDIENPLWKQTPWTRTRHRMDALYGRAFNLINIEPEMLSFIDEHFGLQSLKTVSSTVHFARHSMMTDFKGRNELVSRPKFKEFWKFPTFSVHGSENGLAHISTLDRMNQIFSDAGLDWSPFINFGAGHQDALIGTHRHVTFKQIEMFLDSDDHQRPDRRADKGAHPPLTVSRELEPIQTGVNLSDFSASRSQKNAYAPWIGPIITEERPETTALVVRLGATPSLPAPEGVLMLRINLVDGTVIRRPDGKDWDLPYIVDHMVVYTSKALEECWDAFEAPLPRLMPGHDDKHPGNALLVLLVYDQSFELPDDAEIESLEPEVGLVHEIAAWLPPRPREFNYFFYNAERKLVLELTPTDGLGAPPVVAAGLKFAQFKEMADAALRALTRANTSLIPDVEKRTFSYGPSGQVLHETDQDHDPIDGVIYDPAPTAVPVARATSFTLASCQYPAGFIDEPVAYRSYREIVARLDGNATNKPRFALFVGDQVYVDATAGLYDPTAQDDRYRLPYEAWLRQRDVRNVLRRIPSFMLIDDHEIDDNWEPVKDPADDKVNARMKEDGFNAYKKYQRGRNGGLETFEFDGFHFFMLNTRTERMHRRVGKLCDAELFRQDAMQRLTDWLSTKSGPKFVMTPSILLPRHRRAVQRDTRLDPSNLSALRSDSWDGYPKTLREVLAFIARNKIRHVVFLSGDEHRACVATAHLCDESSNLITRVHSVHTAAMYAPFPFANALDEDFVLDDLIKIDHPSGNYGCKVKAWLPPPGDGATFLSVSQVGGDWKLRCEFSHGTMYTLTL